MRKLILFSLLYLFCFTVPSITALAEENSTSQQQKQPLKLLNWEDYLSPAILAIWEKETGNTVEQIYYDSEKLRDATIYAGDATGIDLVMLGSSAAHFLHASGYTRAINWAQLPNHTLHKTIWREGCGSAASPYLWGTLGIVYRSDVVDPAPTSWKALIEPDEKHVGHIGMMDEYIDTLAPYLFLNGESILTDDQEVLRSAYQALLKQSEAVLTYDYILSFLQSNAAADQLHMALAYGGDETSLNEFAGFDGLWKYAIPKEGTAVWVDCLAILEGAAQPELALAFLAFLDRPEIAAMNARWNRNGTTNEAAQQLLPEDFKNNPQIYPSDQVLERAQNYQRLSKENILTRERILRSVIQAHKARTAK